MGDSPFHIDMGPGDPNPSSLADVATDLSVETSPQPRHAGFILSKERMKCYLFRSMIITCVKQGT